MSIEGVPEANGASMSMQTVKEKSIAVNGMAISNATSIESHGHPPSYAARDLPTSAADGIVKTPFAAPLESSRPQTRPTPTAEQNTKYRDLLQRVSSWTELPETSVRGAANLPLTENERMFLTRECLLRYLRATTWNVPQAETRLKNTLVWRREYGVEKHISDYISIENETGKQLVIGFDVNGRPCQYMRPAKQNTERTPRQIQHLVFMLERSIDMMPPHQETLALLINFAETKSGQGASIGQGRETLNILQNHYPERLGRALVTNVPWVISGFFKMITPFIDPVTREKIRFNEDMSLHVPKEQLLKANGGDVEFEYDHSVYWPALNKTCEIRRDEYKARWKAGGMKIGEHEAYLRGADVPSLAETERHRSEE